MDTWSRGGDSMAHFLCCPASAPSPTLLPPPGLPCSLISLPSSRCYSSVIHILMPPWSLVWFPFLEVILFCKYNISQNFEFLPCFLIWQSFARPACEMGLQLISPLILLCMFHMKLTKAVLWAEAELLSCLGSRMGSAVLSKSLWKKSHGLD